MTCFKCGKPCVAFRVWLECEYVEPRQSGILAACPDLCDVDTNHWRFDKEKRTALLPLENQSALEREGLLTP